MASLPASRPLLSRGLSRGHLQALWTFFQQISLKAVLSPGCPSKAKGSGVGKDAGLHIDSLLAFLQLSFMDVVPDWKRGIQ